jgi:hypothetical protein
MWRCGGPFKSARRHFGDNTPLRGYPAVWIGRTLQRVGPIAWLCNTAHASQDWLKALRRLEPVYDLFDMPAAPQTGRMQGAATRRSGATARSCNAASDRFTGGAATRLPEGLAGAAQAKGRIAALRGAAIRRLLRGPP